MRRRRSSHACPTSHRRRRSAGTAYWSEVTTALSTIDPAALSSAEQVNYAVYREQISALLAQQQFREYEKPLNADTFFWGEPASVARMPLKSETDLRNFISQLNDIPR